MGAANGHTQAGRAHNRWLLLIVALSVSLAACSSGDDAHADDDDRDRRDETEIDAERASSDDDDETTTTTGPPQPDGTQTDAVRPVIQALLTHRDEIVTRFNADPELAGDEDDPLVEEFLTLFEPGSEFAQGSLEHWVRYSGQGISLTPFPDHDTVSETTIEGYVTTVDEDEVTFGHCTVLSYVMYRDGEETERSERTLLPGNGRAVRVDGQWRLVEISTPSDLQGCFTKGGVPE